MSLRGRLYLLSSIALFASCESINLQGRKLSSDEIRGRKYKMKFAASKKTPLTPKQKKARAKGKRAKQARKLNRENLVNQLKESKINQSKQIKWQKEKTKKKNSRK